VSWRFITWPSQHDVQVTRFTEATGFELVKVVATKSPGRPDQHFLRTGGGELITFGTCTTTASRRYLTAIATDSSSAVEQSHRLPRRRPRRPRAASRPLASHGHDVAEIDRLVRFDLYDRPERICRVLHDDRTSCERPRRGAAATRDPHPPLASGGDRVVFHKAAPARGAEVS
jgi:hypothetical protein